MPDSTTYHRFVLAFNSPWNIGTETNHTWHVKFSVSGTITMDDAAGEGTALDLAAPILSLNSAQTSLIEWSYYPSGTNVAALFKTYPVGTHAGTGSAYSAGGGTAQQLEVCILARCPVGKNSRGKPVYLRKWIHDIQSGPGGANSIGPISNPSGVLAHWNTGSGPHNVVPVSPTTGVQGGPWTFENHLYTHQLRRGKKRKAAKSLGDSGLLSDITDLAQLAAALKTLGTPIPPP